MMNAIFDEGPARHHARYLAHLITKSGYLDFDSNKTIPISTLFAPNGGVMIGVLVGRDSEGNELLLKAVSGGHPNIPHWVPHLISEEAYEHYLHTYDEVIKDLSNTPKEQQALSARALEHYTSLYAIPTINKTTVTLNECFEERAIPTGSGDCAAIKLLSYALKQHISVISLVEFFYGNGSREHLNFYTPCSERCRPILKQMLNLEIVYRDEYFIVVNKPSALRSVPGTRIVDSVETRVRTLIPSAPIQCATHRLDMDTSGLIIIALSKEALTRMHRLFRNQEVERTYEALLEGILKEKEASIDLPIRADITNRPYQVVDHTHGKEANTLVKRIRVEEHPEGHYTRVEFTPITGRTHQLRIHSQMGLSMPIVGDRLYGSGMNTRLHLHAKELKFIHPFTEEEVVITSAVDF